MTQRHMNTSPVPLTLLRESMTFAYPPMPVPQFLCREGKQLVSSQSRASEQHRELSRHRNALWSAVEVRAGDDTHRDTAHPAQEYAVHRVYHWSSSKGKRLFTMLHL